MIPEDVIQQIANRADIVEVIREVVDLKKAGRLFRGICPFHSEKDASFTVYPEKQLFKCFGCQKGGNVFGFVMEFYNMTYPEAIRHLGGRYGIDVPEAGGGPSQTGKREQMFEINELAVSFFKKQLQAGEKAQAAVDYIYSKRQLQKETVERFELGFAPNSWDSLLRHLKMKKVSLPLAAELGLIVEKRKGDYYDKFRNRAMFTFRSPAGKVIGFSGRLMEDGEPKYMNSPESLVFKKRSNFFGLNIAGRPISQKKRVIICEGNFDLVVMHQYGFDTTVAVLGSAITEQHVRVLGRYSNNIYLMFDGDTSGRKAMWRAIEMFLPSKVHPRCALLPQGEDPDSFLCKNGADEMEALLEKAPLALDFAVDHLLGKAKDVESKTRGADDLSRLLSLIDDPVRRDYYIRQGARLAGIREVAFREKLQGVRSSRSRNAFRATKTNPQGAFAKLPDAVLTLLALSLSRPKLANRAVVDDAFDYMVDNPLADTAQRVITALSEHPEGEEFQTGSYLSLIADPELSERITGLVVEYEDLKDEEADLSYEDLLRTMKIDTLNRRIEQVKAQIVDVQKMDDKSRLIQLLREKQDLERLKDEEAGDFHTME